MAKPSRDKTLTIHDVSRPLRTLAVIRDERRYALALLISLNSQARA